MHWKWRKNLFRLPEMRRRMHFVNGRAAARRLAFYVILIGQKFLRRNTGRLECICEVSKTLDGLFVVIVRIPGSIC